jgi:putative ABC transport system permease protein
LKLRDEQSVFSSASYLNQPFSWEGKMKALPHDLRYWLRVFWQRPGLSLPLVLALALGIGGATTMFSVLYGVILQPLPVREPDRLVALSGAGAPPAGDAVDWWSQGQTFESLCEYRAGGVTLTEGASPVRALAAMTSSSFFSVLGVAPQLGRTFTVEDEQAGRNRVVIVSERLWRQNFARDPGVIGREITLEGVGHTIVGVMPGGFNFPGRSDIWVPRARGGGSISLGEEDQADLPSSLRSRMIGRLRDGVSLQHAQAQLAALFNRYKEISAQAGRAAGSVVRVIPLHETLVGQFRQAFWALFAGVGLLLLIACANAANLLIARGTTRQKEIAIRLCLGAGPRRIVRQLLTEALLFAMVSGALGVLLAYWGVGLIRAFGPSDVPRLAAVRVNLVALSFALIVSFLVGIVVGLAPAMQAWSTKLAEVFKDEGARSASGFRRRARHAIVVAEIALALMLAVGAGLTIRSLFRLTSVDPGFDPQSVVSMNISLPGAKYFAPPATAAGSHTPAGAEQHAQAATATTGARTVEFYRRLLEESQRLPGVVAAGSVNQLPLGSSREGSLSLKFPGPKYRMALYYTSAGDYFRALGIPSVRGRTFAESDTETAPKVVIINETLARVQWGDQNPVGQTLVIEGEAGIREIVGVVGDTKQKDLTRAAEPQFYLPYRQRYGGGQPPLNLTLVVRAQADPKLVINSLRGLVASIDRDLAVFRVRTMEDVIADSTAAYRFRGMLFGLFALLALLLSVVGVYGVAAYSVSARTREIGIRLSLGAEPRDILLMVLREGTALALIGVTMGIVTSFWLSRLITGLLYGVSASDPGTLIVAALVLVVGALLACALPALAASKVDPATALRYE